MAIINPNPITPSSMTKVWIPNLTINFPIENNGGSIFAGFYPYDGIGSLLATDRPPALTINNAVNQIEKYPLIPILFSNLEVELSRLSGYSNNLISLRVIAPDPKRPVKIIVTYTERRLYVIDDAYALCATDSTFASVFSSAMGMISILAGLQVS